MLRKVHKQNISEQFTTSSTNQQPKKNIKFQVEEEGILEKLLNTVRANNEKKYSLKSKSKLTAQSKKPDFTINTSNPQHNKMKTQPPADEKMINAKYNINQILNLYISDKHSNKFHDRTKPKHHSKELKVKKIILNERREKSTSRKGGKKISNTRSTIDHSHMNLNTNNLPLTDVTSQSKSTNLFLSSDGLSHRQWKKRVTRSSIDFPKVNGESGLFNKSNNSTDYIIYNKDAMKSNSFINKLESNGKPKTIEIPEDYNEYLNTDNKNESISKYDMIQGYNNKDFKLKFELKENEPKNFFRKQAPLRGKTLSLVDNLPKIGLKRTSSMKIDVDIEDNLEKFHLLKSNLGSKNTNLQVKADNMNIEDKSNNGASREVNKTIFCFSSSQEDQQMDMENENENQGEDKHNRQEDSNGMKQDNHEYQPREDNNILNDILNITPEKKNGAEFLSDISMNLPNDPGQNIFDFDQIENEFARSIVSSSDAEEEDLLGDNFDEENQIKKEDEEHMNNSQPIYDQEATKSKIKPLSTLADNECDKSFKSEKFLLNTNNQSEWATTKEKIFRSEYNSPKKRISKRRTIIERRPSLLRNKILGSSVDVVRKYSMLNPSVYNLSEANKMVYNKMRSSKLNTRTNFNEIIIKEETPRKILQFDSSSDESGRSYLKFLKDDEDEDIKLIQLETKGFDMKKTLLRKSFYFIQTALDSKFTESDKLIKKKKLLKLYRKGFFDFGMNIFMDKQDNEAFSYEEEMKIQTDLSLSMNIHFREYLNSKYFELFKEITRVLNDKDLYTENQDSTKVGTLIENFTLGNMRKRQRTRGFNTMFLHAYDSSSIIKHIGLANHIYINGLIIRDCKGNYETLNQGDLAEGKGLRYFKRNSSKRLSLELDKLRKLSMFDNKLSPRKTNHDLTVKKRVLFQGERNGSDEAGEDETPRHGIHTSNIIKVRKKSLNMTYTFNDRREKKKKTEDFKIDKRAISELSKAVNKLSEFSVLKSPDFYYKSNSGIRNRILSPLKRNSQMKKNVLKLSGLNNVAITKENTMFRTNEIKTNLISSLPPNSFQSLSFYIKDGDYVHFFNDYEKNKIHVNSVDEENNSLLNLAVQCNCPEIVEFLLCKGADPNLQNNTLNTPLHYALSHRNFVLANILIKYRANEELPNKLGLTPWQCLGSMKEVN